MSDPHYVIRTADTGCYVNRAAPEWRGGMVDVLAEAETFRTQAGAEAVLARIDEMSAHAGDWCVVRVDMVPQETAVPRPDAEPALLCLAREVLLGAALCNDVAGRRLEVFGDGLAFIESQCGAVGVIRQIPRRHMNLTGIVVDGIDLTEGAVIADGVALEDIVMSAVIRIGGEPVTPEKGGEA